MYKLLVTNVENAIAWFLNTKDRNWLRRTCQRKRPSCEQLLNPAVVPLPCSNVLMVAARRSSSDELLQGQERSIPVRLAKVGNGISLRDDLVIASLHARGISDAVARSPKGIVGKPLERVADVDDDIRVRGRNHVVERAVLVLVLDLEPAGGVLEEQGERAEVGVLGDARGGAVREGRGRDLRVVQEPELVLGLVVQGPDVLLRDAEGDGDGGEELQFRLESLVVELLHEGAEAREGFLCDPYVVYEVIICGSHVVSFLQKRLDV